MLLPQLPTSLRQTRDAGLQHVGLGGQSPQGPRDPAGTTHQLAGCVGWLVGQLAHCNTPAYGVDDDLAFVEGKSSGLVGDADDTGLRQALPQ
jgi:hypothetical protein